MENKKMNNKKNITRFAICEAIHKNVGLTQKMSQKIIEDILQGLETFIGTNGEVKIVNFGTFKKYKTNPRMVNIPGKKKGEKILGKKLLEERVKCKFKPSTELKNRINHQIGN